MWADNDAEKQDLYDQCVRVFEKPPVNYMFMSREERYAWVRSSCVNRELDKCLKAGVIEDKEKIIAMLKDEAGISTAALQIVYVLREKRLG